MSGISSITNPPATSGTSSSLSSSSTGSSSLPNGGLSSVGASLLSSGSAPNPTQPAGTSTATKQSPYTTEFQTLQQQDTAELLYASFLSPSDALANVDSVLQQAASLLGTPGRPGSIVSYSPTLINTASSATANLPSVSSILAASDEEAQKTLSNYVSNSSTGASIIDAQA